MIVSNGITLDEYLELVDGNIQCKRCGFTFGSENINYKLRARFRELDLYQAGLIAQPQDRLVDRRVVFRQFFCPQCGVNIENETVLADAEPIWDKRPSVTMQDQAETSV